MNISDYYNSTAIENIYVDVNYPKASIIYKSNPNRVYEYTFKTPEFAKRFYEGVMSRLKSRYYEPDNKKNSVGAYINYLRYFDILIDYRSYNIYF